MSKCIQICTVESLGLASDYSGYLRRFEDKLWFSDGITWMEISGKNEILSYPLVGQDIFSIADRNFIITDYYFLYPSTDSFSSLFLNGELYVTGTPIYYGDVLKIICDEPNTLVLHKEYFDIPTLNLQPTFNYNCLFRVDSPMTYQMMVGIKNVSLVPTTSTIQFYVQKLTPIADFVVSPTLTDISTPLSTYYVSNSDFTILEQATRWRFTSNSGVVINPMSTLWVGFEIVATAIGNGNLTVTVVSNTGGNETPTTDNIAVKQYTVSSI